MITKFFSCGVCLLHLLYVFYIIPVVAAFGILQRVYSFASLLPLSATIQTGYHTDQSTRQAKQSHFYWKIVLKNNMIMGLDDRTRSYNQGMEMESNDFNANYSPDWSAVVPCYSVNFPLIYFPL